MEITLKTFLIVCPLVFLAGVVDAIGGGGGLISLPAYLFAGIPLHMSIATNKLSAAMGTSVSTIKFIREKLINFKLVLPTIVTALIGSYIGANLSLLSTDRILKTMLLPVLLVAAFFVINKKVFGKNYPDLTEIPRSTYIVATLAALVVGVYDGFYGPGTGTFLIILLNIFAKLNLRQANAQTKAINLTTNVMSLAVFIVNGQVMWKLGLIAGICGIAGNYLGASLAIRKSERITRPIILIVLSLLFLKIITS